MGNQSTTLILRASCYTQEHLHGIYSQLHDWTNKFMKNIIVVSKNKEIWGTCVGADWHRAGISSDPRDGSPETVLGVLRIVHPVLCTCAHAQRLCLLLSQLHHIFGREDLDIPHVINKSPVHIYNGQFSSTQFFINQDNLMFWANSRDSDSWTHSNFIILFLLETISWSYAYVSEMNGWF